MTGKVVAVNVSAKKGEKKQNINQALLVEEHGIEHDAHSGGGIRQVSLLSLSSVNKMRLQGLEIEYGDFAENITVDGLEVKDLPLGSRLKAGQAVLEVTQIGKECHNKGCAIKIKAGDCVMPREGIFARVISGGLLEVGDPVEVIGG